MEAIDPDEAANLGLHLGARAGHAGAQQTFIERYSDLAYIGVAIVIMLVSGIGGFVT